MNVQDLGGSKKCDNPSKSIGSHSTPHLCAAGCKELSQDIDLFRFRPRDGACRCYTTVPYPCTVEDDKDGYSLYRIIHVNVQDLGGSKKCAGSSKSVGKHSTPLFCAAACKDDSQDIDLLRFRQRDEACRCYTAVRYPCTVEDDKDGYSLYRIEE